MRLRFTSVGLLLAAVLVACTPSSTPQGRQPDAPSQSAAAPKRLTISIMKEPSSFNRDLTRDFLTGGVEQVIQIAHQYLSIADDTGKRIPQVAVEAISVEGGTWAPNPDGTMDTTWRLRRDVKWHDGRPFTSADMLFTFQVIKDPNMPNRLGATTALMESVTAPDPHTFVVHWSSHFIGADQALGLIPLSRHLMEDAYVTLGPNFVESPLFKDEFTGLGPYKLSRWEPGVFIEFSRFDEFYKGRPPLDTIVVRFIPDPNAAVANIMSNSVDVVLPEGVDLDAAAELRDRWQGTGHQVMTGYTGAFRLVEIQFRPEYQQPRNALSHQLVRQALYHGVDRKTMTEVMTQGFAPVADVWFPAGHPFLAEVHSAAPQYPFDPARAQQLLTQDGWVQNAEGVLVYQPTGERFEMEARNSPSAGAEKSLNILATNWKALGVQVEMLIIPSARATDREYRSTAPGVGMTALTYENIWTDRLHSKSASSNANRWSGPNRTGYNNPRVDATLDRLNGTIPIAPRIELHRELIREALTDVALMPMYWEVSPTLALKHVKNLGKNAQNINTWNMFEWTVD